MAKISEIKYNFHGEERKLNINVGADGYFKANLPDDVSEALFIREKKIENKTLSDLTSWFITKLEEYKMSTKTQTVHIGIRYKACGRLNKYAEGEAVLFSQRSGFHLDVTFGGIDAVGLTFKVFICENTDGVERWFSAQKGSEMMSPPADVEPDKYYKQGSMQDSVRDFTLISYSPEALHTLTVAQEKMRMLSEMLFKFISSTPVEIEATLKNQKLLA